MGGAGGLEQSGEEVVGRSGGLLAAGEFLAAKLVDLVAGELAGTALGGRMRGALGRGRSHLGIVEASRSGDTATTQDQDGLGLTGSPDRRSGWRAPQIQRPAVDDERQNLACDRRVDGHPSAHDIGDHAPGGIH
jgi:hypothetical protein